MPQTPASNLALSIEAILGALPFIAIAGLNIVFALRGWTPLTQLVENYLRRYPPFAAAISLFIGALVGHVFWSFGNNPSAPPGSALLLLLALGIAVGTGVVGAISLMGLALLLRWAGLARGA